MIDPLTFVALALSAGATVLALHVKRASAARAETVVLESRITRIETRVEGMPSSEAIHELALVVARIEGDVKALCTHIDGVEAGMRRIETIVNRQEEWLLNRGREAK
jgi:hypothetical protein